MKKRIREKLGLPCIVLTWVGFLVMYLGGIQGSSYVMSLVGLGVVAIPTLVVILFW